MEIKASDGCAANCCINEVGMFGGCPLILIYICMENTKRVIQGTRPKPVSVLQNPRKGSFLYRSLGSLLTVSPTIGPQSLILEASRNNNSDPGKKCCRRGTGNEYHNRIGVWDGGSHPLSRKSLKLSRTLPAEVPTGDKSVPLREGPWCVLKLSPCM